MNEQFVDRVINILTEITRLRRGNWGGRGQSGGGLKDPGSRAKVAAMLIAQRKARGTIVHRSDGNGQSKKPYQGNPTGIKLGNNIRTGGSDIKTKGSASKGGDLESELKGKGVVFMKPKEQYRGK